MIWVSTLNWVSHIEKRKNTKTCDIVVVVVVNVNDAKGPIEWAPIIESWVIKNHSYTFNIKLGR